MDQKGLKSVRFAHQRLSQSFNIVDIERLQLRLMENSYHHHHPENEQMQHEHHDHAAHHRMMIADFRKRFIVSLILTLPILALSPMIQGWLHLNFRFPGSNYLLFALASFVFFYGGWPFLKRIFDELKVINLVREVQESKSEIQQLIDKAAFWLTVTVLTVGFATLFVWLSYMMP